MKFLRGFIIILFIIFVFGLFCGYVYVGTYIFPIAPHWITQLPPNPPKPKVTHGEFDFKLVYSIEGMTKEINDTLVCDFSGFEVIELGGDKTRVWIENLKNKNNYELFHFRDEERNTEMKTYSSICIEDVDKYKIVLRLPGAEWFLDEPTYKGTPDMPDIYVYDTTTRYYIDSESCDDLLHKHNFKIISWYCDKPIDNTFTN